MISIQNNIYLTENCTSDNDTPARSYVNYPVSQGDIEKGVERVLDEVSSKHKKMGDSYFAMGIQSYQWADGKYKGTGPLADLYPVEQRNFDGVGALTKTGFHNQNIEKPSWEIHKDGQEIELLASSAKKVSGASCHDVPWLYVELETNDYGIAAIVRSHTRGGIAPDKRAEGARVGVGYMTVYTLIYSQEQYKECDA